MLWNAYHRLYSDVTNGGAHIVGSGVAGAFYGNVEYEQSAFYGNAEYVLNDQWMLFAGLRFNEDHKEHVQNDFTSAGQSTNADGQLYNTVNGIFRNSTVNETCCGYVGINKDADGNAIPVSYTHLTLPTNREV